MNIRTNFQYFRWVAVDDDTYDGPGDPLGEGRTEQEAIDDLKEQLAEHAELCEARRNAFLTRLDEDLENDEPPKWPFYALVYGVALWLVVGLVVLAVVWWVKS